MKIAGFMHIGFLSSVVLVACGLTAADRVFRPGRFYLNCKVHGVGKPFLPILDGYLGMFDQDDIEKFDYLPVETIQFHDEMWNGADENVFEEPTAVQEDAGIFELRYINATSSMFTLQYSKKGPYDGYYVQVDPLLRVLRFGLDVTTIFEATTNADGTHNFQAFFEQFSEVDSSFLALYFVDDMGPAVIAMGSAQHLSENAVLTTAFDMVQAVDDIAFVEDGRDVFIKTHTFALNEHEKTIQSLYYGRIGCFNKLPNAPRSRDHVRMSALQLVVKDSSPALSREVDQKELQQLARIPGHVMKFRQIPKSDDTFVLQCSDKLTAFYGMYMSLDNGILVLQQGEPCMFRLETVNGSSESFLRIVNVPADESYLHALYTTHESIWIVGPKTFINQGQKTFTMMELAAADELYDRENISAMTDENDQNWYGKISIMRKKYNMDDNNGPRRPTSMSWHKSLQKKKLRGRTPSSRLTLQRPRNIRSHPMMLSMSPTLLQKAV